MNEVIENMTAVINALETVNTSGSSNWGRLLGAVRVIGDFVQDVSDGKIVISSTVNSSELEKREE